MSPYEKQHYIKQAIRHGFNLAVIGPHGIGKTEAIRSWVQDEMPEFKCVYISLAGMSKEDLAAPFPVERDGERYVQYLPHEIMDDRTDDGRKPIVLVLDEFNRNITDQQIYNALLEMMSIRTMLGRKVNLHSVVALMNPTDDSRYVNTTELEVTMRDRIGLYFRVQGYDLGADEYLLRRYPQTAPAMIEWYLSLSEEKQQDVSPRRQEYLLRAYQLGFPLELAVPDGIQLPTGTLVDLLQSGRVWTVQRLLRDPESAVSVIQSQPNLVPLFFALLKAVTSDDHARQLVPVVMALPPHVRLALVQSSSTVWWKALQRVKE